MSRLLKWVVSFKLQVTNDGWITLEQCINDDFYVLQCSDLGGQCQVYLHKAQLNTLKKLIASVEKD